MDTAAARDMCKLFPGHPTICPCDCTHYARLQALGRSRVCSKANLAAIRKNCPKAIDECADLKARLDAVRNHLASVRARHTKAEQRWRNAQTALERARADYVETERRLKVHTQQAFNTAASYIECARRFNIDELQAALDDIRTSLINDCLAGDYNPEKCDPMQQDIAELQRNKDFSDDKCFGPKELWERERDYWNELYQEDLPLKEGYYNDAAKKESDAADNFENARDLLRRAETAVQSLEREYAEKCKDARGEEKKQ
ncbi:hypothetical protein NB231_05290 [Nitrococcus mobilis Nb-231]|uniref:Uncharacterized protein n=1 Tax=Nitrococcus mobilis Nb-231 TaxID=314278 RepID=A4BQE2_9GAMM|nr:hypothetical protein NB231_05290 [Nitrococcus mobilis Nb-231]